MDGFRLALFATAVVLLRSSSAIADEPTVEELLKTVPVLSPDNKALTSFQCVVRLPVSGATEPRYVKVHLAWSSPDDRTCLIIDDHTNVPFAFWAEKKVMLYDATSATVTLVEGALPSFELQVKDKSLRLGYGFASQGKMPSFLVDLSSLVHGTKDDHVVEQLREHRWQMTSTAHSGTYRVVATFDFSKKHPFQGIDVIEAKSDQSIITVDEIQIDEVGDSPIRQFPVAAEFPPDVKIEEITDGDDRDAAGSRLGKAFFRIFLARHALDNEGIRKNVLLKNIDWDAAQRTDEIAGPSLRVLFGLPEK